MSTYLIRVIPCDPSYVPPAAAQEQARDLMARALPKPAYATTETVVEAETSSGIEFICQMQNFESVACPACSRRVDIDWWNDQMNLACETGFEERRVTMPCCGVITDLNDLDYVMPTGFARFTLTALDPGVAELGPKTLDALARVLGCEVREVFVRI